MLYIAYLDEFGHIGPYLSRTDPHHNTSPVFGLGSLVLPYDRVRNFATWFFQLESRLLKFEISRSNVPAHQWEKKGSALYTTRNVLRYPQLRQATNRILNQIEKDGGLVFYVGLERRKDVGKHNPKRVYTTALRESIKRLDQFCDRRGA